MDLANNQKVLILRFGKKEDCIEKHQETEKQYGYCWFGKIGVVPAKKSIEMVKEEENPAIVLYSQGKAYIAKLEDVTYAKPDEGIPQYYKDELFEKAIYPNSYYKICEIERLPIDILKKMTIVSSRNNAIDTLHHSMSSFFLAEYSGQ